MKTSTKIIIAAICALDALAIFLTVLLTQNHEQARGPTLTPKVLADMRSLGQIEFTPSTPTAGIVSVARAIAGAGGVRGSGTSSLIFGRLTDEDSPKRAWNRPVWMLMSVARAVPVCRGGPIEVGRHWVSPHCPTKPVETHGFIFVDARTGRYIRGFGY